MVSELYFLIENVKISEIYTGLYFTAISSDLAVMAFILSNNFLVPCLSNLILYQANNPFPTLTP